MSGSLRQTARFARPALPSIVTSGTIAYRSEKGRVFKCDAASIDLPDLGSFPPRSISTRSQASAGVCISPKLPQKLELPLRTEFRDACATARKREPIDFARPFHPGPCNSYFAKSATPPKFTLLTSGNVTSASEMIRAP
jgi:hypothetical protein